MESSPITRHQKYSVRPIELPDVERGYLETLANLSKVTLPDDENQRGVYQKQREILLARMGTITPYNGRVVHPYNTVVAVFPISAGASAPSFLFVTET